MADVKVAEAVVNVVVVDAGGNKNEVFCSKNVGEDE